MGLALVAVFLYAGSLSTSEIVAKQAEPNTTASFGQTLPGLVLRRCCCPSFVIYLISMVGETNRAPFDLPEAEGELVGGFHTEYSSMRFAMFFMAEYMNMITVSALATTLFLGGWHAPLPFNLIPGLDQGYWGVLWFVLKVLVLLFIFVWLRGTLPRLRYDQFMRFGWRWLIPISLVWIVLVATLRLGQRRRLVQPARPFWVVAVVIFVVLIALTFFGGERAAGEGRAGAGRRPSTPSPAAIRCRRWATRCCPSWPGAHGATEEDTEVPGVMQPRASPPSGRSDRGDPTRRERGLMGVFDPIAGFGVTFKTMFRKTFTEDYPNEPEGDRAAVPRPPPAEPLARRAGEVRRLRAVRLGLPGRRDLRRGRAEHRGGAVLARGALRPRLPDQLPALHPLRSVHRGLPDPGADHDQRVRARRRHPGSKLIYEKSDLLAPLLPGMEQPPHERRLGDDEQAYFLGLPATGQPDDRAG